MPHEHRYYMQSVKKEFEPLEIKDPTRPDAVLYEITEYAYMFASCCMIVTKVKVKQESQNNDES